MMPQSAIDAAEPDLVLPAKEIASALARLAEEPVPPTMQPASDPLLDDEEYIKVDRASSDHPQAGSPSGFVCPDCGGALWESESANGLLNFRCRTGHGYSVETLLAGQNEIVEGALWAALRALEERAAMSRRMADRLRRRGTRSSAARFERQADAAVQQALVIRDALQHITPLADPAGAAGAGA
jgi:two-component system chemotaxis response regulator CheB